MFIKIVDIDCFLCNSYPCVPLRAATCDYPGITVYS